MIVLFAASLPVSPFISASLVALRRLWWTWPGPRPCTLSADIHGDCPQVMGSLTALLGSNAACQRLSIVELAAAGGPSSTAAACHDIVTSAARR